MRIDLHDGFYLGPIQDGDQDAYVEHFSDKDTTDRLLKIPYPYTKVDAENWVQYCLKTTQMKDLPNHFALRQADGFLVGGVGLLLNSGTEAHRAEIGYWLAKKYRDQGLMTSAVRAATRYAFQFLDRKRIEAIPFSTNIASHRVLEKAGFTREGFLAAYHLKDGVPIDAYIFAILELGAPSPS